MTKPQASLTPIDINNLRRLFATKQDLKAFATKKDLLPFATKKDLLPFATKKDLNQKLQQQRNDIIDVVLKHLDKNYATKHDLEELKDQIKNLPTKEEFFSRMDKLSGEYQTFTQEKIALMHRLEQMLATRAN